MKPLIALLAIVNPIGVVSFFIHFTPNLTPAQRRRTMQVSAFFGISIASFQVGGGMLLLSSLQMLNAQPAEFKPNDVIEGDAKIDPGASIAVVPLTIWWAMAWWSLWPCCWPSSRRGASAGCWAAPASTS